MLTNEQIKHIANLARLELTPEEETKYGEQLSAILNYVDKLSEVNTDNVSITAQTGGLTNAWREDEVKPWPEEEVLSALAQGETSGGQVKVKRVL
jgi:glutamyl-tRNA(Gln) and/or aspartyl-tRNA(Asn) amidotransferase, C subunit